MLGKIREWIDKNKLLNAGDKIVVACSGGPDSLALLHILYTLRLEYNISIFVAHVDHMFRGIESAQEAAFVVDFCNKLGITCYHTAIDVPKFIKESKLSGQDASRFVRYRYLRQVAQQLGGAKIATGHHQDDQAETVLINLLRGAGSVGIRGIQAINGDIIRPLLAVNRAEITAYCEEHKLQPRFDSSNAKTHYLRNRIRLTLLPELEEQYNVGVKDALCRTATIVGDEHDFIQDTAKKLWLKVVKEQDDSLFISEKEMKSVHIAVKREIFRMAIEKKIGCLTGITFNHVETLIEMLLRGRVGSILELPKGLSVYKSYDGLYLGVARSIIPPKIDPPGQVVVVPGITNIPELGIRIIAEVTDRLPKGQTNEAVFDWSALSSPLFVRTRQNGDRFQPLGLKGSKKLKEFFIDTKVPQQDRDWTPIVCDSQGIIWVGGYRQADKGKVNSKTREFLKLSIMGNTIKK